MAGNKVFVSQNPGEALMEFRRLGAEAKEKRASLRNRYPSASDHEWLENWKARAEQLAPFLDPNSRSTLHQEEAHLEKIIDPIHK